MARLRMLLPELLHVKAAGASGNQIMEFLGSQGLKFPSRKAFYMAFERAQQAGPLLLASTNVTEKPITKVQETTQEESLYSQEAASSSQAGPSQKDRDYVVPVITSKSRDVRIDKNNMYLKNPDGGEVKTLILKRFRVK